MHVILVGNYKSDRQESMLRYVDMVASGLRARGVVVTQVQPEPWLGKLKPGTHDLGKWLGYVDKYLIFPFSLGRTIRSARKQGGQVILHICDHSNAMYARKKSPVRQIITCHDLLAVRSALGHFPENPVGWSGCLLQRWIVSGLRRADHIVCVSEATRRDLLALGGFDIAKSKTLYNGLNYPYAPRDKAWMETHLSRLSEVKFLGPQGYIFHIGGDAWYKNRAGLLRIYFEYVKQGGRLPLVMAGAPLNNKLRNLVDQRPDEAQVIAVGSVSNEELNALYGRAACLLFPSLYEGFGWPVLEASAAGCLVVCSDRSSLPEVGAGAAFYSAPNDYKKMGELLLKVLSGGAEVRESRISIGLRHSLSFDNSYMVDGLICVYSCG